MIVLISCILYYFRTIPLKIMFDSPESRLSFEKMIQFDTINKFLAIRDDKFIN